ncbi:MAG: ribonuclease H-like domain-containing protein [Nitrospirae bacterium]|nr:ribonuclease H-like domain-containing protein [Nitrospirota bacterium]
MLTSTFIFLKGVGEFSERRLWEEGVTTWDAFLASQTLPGISRARKALYDPDVTAAREQFARRNARYFSRCLKPRDQWRLFDAFRSRTVFLDIETTGTAPHEGEVTMVGLYGAGRMTTLIRNDSLTGQRLADELDRYDLIVTFFGSGFDLPFLKAKYPRLQLDQPHFVLCFAARRLGYHGGLKQIESTLGITRHSSVQGMDGWEAVRLWYQWQAGDEQALSRLVTYNAADTKNLEPLADHLYRELVSRSGLSAQHRST